MRILTLAEKIEASWKRAMEEDEKKNFSFKMWVLEKVIWGVEAEAIMHGMLFKPDEQARENVRRLMRDLSIDREVAIVHFASSKETAPMYDFLRDL